MKQEAAMACRGGLSAIVVALGMVAGTATAVAAGVETYCPTLKWVLRVPAGDSRVQVIDVSRGVTPLATLWRPRRGRVVAVEVQVESRRVWVLAEDGLDAHESYSGRLLGHWSTPAGLPLDRLTVDGDGRIAAWRGARAYVPENGAAVLVGQR